MGRPVECFHFYFGLFQRMVVLSLPKFRSIPAGISQYDGLKTIAISAMPESYRLTSRAEN